MGSPYFFGENRREEKRFVLVRSLPCGKEPVGSRPATARMSPPREENGQPRSRSCDGSALALLGVEELQGGQVNPVSEFLDGGAFWLNGIFVAPTISFNDFFRPNIGLIASQQDAVQSMFARFF